MKCFVCAVWALAALPAVGQLNKADSKSSGGDQANVPTAIPVRTVEFSPSKNPLPITLSPVTSLPVCNTQGVLFLNEFDPKDLRKQTLVSLQDEAAKTFDLSTVGDVHDVTVFSFFPTNSAVAILLRGSKAQQVVPSSGTSPAGYPWETYHQYAAIFDLDGRYKESIELHINYQLYRLGLLPSGEILVAGYDKLNSVPRLTMLNSSGDFLRNIDAPVFRNFKSAGTSSPLDAMKESRNAIGDVVFSPFGESLLVWRRGQTEAVLVVGRGGSVREVPLQPVDGYAFVEFIPATSRWIAHYRALKAPPDSPFTADGYSYFELRPQDATVSDKLVIAGDVPQYIACESDGVYITYKVGTDGKLLLYAAQ